MNEIIQAFFRGLKVGSNRISAKREENMIWRPWKRIEHLEERVKQADTQNEQLTLTKQKLLRNLAVQAQAIKHLQDGMTHALSQANPVACMQELAKANSEWIQKTAEGQEVLLKRLDQARNNLDVLWAFLVQAGEHMGFLRGQLKHSNQATFEIKEVQEVLGEWQRAKPLLKA